MPPKRTNYASASTFTRPAPESVVYDLGIPGQAIITLPAGSAWTSGPHWHDAHTEYLQVLEGAAEIFLAGHPLMPAVTPDAGVITVPRGVVHEWRRARAAGAERVVVREWTEPRDGGKEVFFRNLNGLVLDFGKARAEDRSGVGRWWEEWMLGNELRCLFWRCGNWPVLLRQDSWWSDWMQRVVTKMVLGSSVVLGMVLGRRGVYPEYCRLPAGK